MAKKQSKSVGKILLVTVLAIFGVLAVVLDIWCGYIHFFGKKKETSTTVHLGDQTITAVDASTGETITQTKTFLEVNVFNNAVEIRFNDLVDETQTAFYSQGIQFIVKDNYKKTLASKDIFDGSYGKELSQKTEYEEQVVGGEFLTLHAETLLKTVVTNKNYKYLDIYEYQSADDFETSLNSNLLQSGDEFFKLQIKEGDKKSVIGMKFKDYNVIYEKGIPTTAVDFKSLTYVGKSAKDKYVYDGIFTNYILTTINQYYRAYDLSYFLEYIASAVQGIAGGFVGETIIKMPDIFNFYKMNNVGEYTEMVAPSDAFMKLNNTTVSYDKIKITVHDKDLESSSQSMFNKLRNYQNYSTNGEFIDMTDYLSGRCLLTATLDDLDWISTETPNVYKFALSEDFKEKWQTYKNNSFVKVEIDQEYLIECGITYDGFDLTSVEDYVLYQITTTQNEILYQGVQYAWLDFRW